MVVSNNKSKSNKPIASTVNIKAEPVTGHMGVLRFTNNDWAVVAYLIPRDALKTKYITKELEHVGIYFLVGHVGSIEKIYVGRSYLRNCGKSFLERLGEHDTSKTDSYRKIWKYIIAVTDKDGAWNDGDANALERIFYHKIPEINRLNACEPTGDLSKLSEDKIKYTEDYLNIIGVNTFADKDDDTANQIQTILDSSLSVEDLQRGMSRIPEIVTPHRVVKQMVDLLPSELFNPDTKFLDPACKGGEYLKAIYDRLMESPSMKSTYPNQIERSNHILFNQLYGIALSTISKERTKTKLLGFEYNIRVIPNYISILKDRLVDRNKMKKITLSDAIKEEFKQDMKFDVVIGNPPYQESTGSGLNESGGKPLFDEFISKSIDVSEQYVCMITPTKWMTGNQQNYVALREKLVADNHMRKMVDFFNPVKIFPGTQIAGGVSYFLFDKGYNGDTEFVSDITVGTKREPVSLDRTDNRKFNTTGIIPRFSIGEYVINKIRAVDDGVETLDKHVYKDLWKLPTDFSNLHLAPTEKENIHVLTPREYYYVSEDDVPNIGIGTYKVSFTRAVNGSTFLLDTSKSVLSTIRVLEPNEICNNSYMVVCGISKKEYAENIKSYLETKFVRFLILQTLFGIGLTADRFQFVPLQDFSHPWTDEMLYKKYNLTDEEISYIEKIIKPITGDSSTKAPKPKLDREAYEANYLNKLINN